MGGTILLGGGRPGRGIEHRHVEAIDEAADRSIDAGRAERLLVAQELHDGILQEFTVVGFELKTLFDAAGPEARPAIALARDILQKLQGQLRTYVGELRGEPATGSARRLAEVLAGAAPALQRQMTGRLHMYATPDGATVAQEEILPLRLVLAEAVAEVTRWCGGADITAAVELGRSFRITLSCDGGVGLVAATGSKSLDMMLRDWGGTCRREETKAGGTLLIELPRS